MISVFVNVYIFLKNLYSFCSFNRYLSSVYCVPGAISVCIEKALELVLQHIYIYSDHLCLLR